MPFRIKGNELIEQLRHAKEQEIAAIERLHAYMQSPDLQQRWLKKLTDDMAATCELSARLWRELHDVVPDPTDNSG
jgi:hypothetical protein